MLMKTQLINLLLVLALTITPVAAQDAASRASTASMESLSLLPAATLELVAAGGTFSVVALRPVGHAIEIVLRTADSSAEVTIHVSTEAARAASLALGSTIEVVAVSAGYLLMAAAQAIAFVPDAVVATLVHRSEMRR